MLHGIDITYQLLPYNLFLLFAYLWFVWTYRKSSLLLFITTLFFAGLFNDFGDILLYNIFFGGIKHLRLGRSVFEFLTLMWVFVLFKKYYSRKIVKNNAIVVISFVIYLLWTLAVSIFVHFDSTTLLITKLNRDFVPFFMFLVLSFLMQSKVNTEVLYSLFYRLLIAQVTFSILKFILLMNIHEGMVGSLTGLTNGAPGTTLPLLGLLFIGISTKMKISVKDTLIILGLLFTGFLAGKRAVWFLFPILFFLLSVYVYRQMFIRKLFLASLLIPLIIYLGFRLIPSLNPEERIWGSFNPNYAWNYGIEYSAGTESNYGKIQKGYGRIGALTLGLDHVVGQSSTFNEVLFGHGMNYFNVPNELYDDSSYWFGIEGMGSITGILYSYFSLGFISVLFYILYLFTILNQTKLIRLKHVIFLFVFIDYIFYNTSILNITGLFVLLIFIILYKAPIAHNNRKKITL